MYMRGIMQNSYLFEKDKVASSGDLVDVYFRHEVRVSLFSDPAKNTELVILKNRDFSYHHEHRKANAHKSKRENQRRFESGIPKPS